LRRALRQAFAAALLCRDAPWEWHSDEIATPRRYGDDFLSVTILEKWRKPLILLVRAESFELPTLWV
jgi:hypothetical protein